MNKRRSCVMAAAAAAIVLAGPAQHAHADGTEELGPPVGLVLAAGTEILAGGTGLIAGQPQSFDVPVPAGVTVEQVIAYWEGQALSAVEQGDTDDITLNGNPVEGVRIGGPTNFFGSVWTSSYRADVTSLGLVVPGALNTVEADGLDFADDNDGIGLMVIVRDGDELSVIECADGNDNAFIDFAPPLDTTEPVTFAIAPSLDDRPGKLHMMIGSIAPMRPNVVEISYDGMLADVLVDELMDSVGEDFDVYSTDLLVPAGATSITIQLLSDDLARPFPRNHPAPLAWSTCCVVVSPPDEPPPTGDEGCTPGFWKQEHHFGHYPEPYTPWTLFSDAFNNPDAFPGMTLVDVLSQGGGGLKALGRHSAAGLLNAASMGVEYALTVDGVIDGFNDAFDDGSKSAYNAQKDIFADANEEGCPLDGQSFWGDEAHAGHWPEPLHPGMGYRDIFAKGFNGKTLGQVLKKPGKGRKALAAEAVTALLNAAAPDSGFPMTPEELVDFVDTAMSGKKADIAAAREVLAGLNAEVCVCDLE